MQLYRLFLQLLLLPVLYSTSQVNDFVPLSCNANISTVPCTLWTSTTYGTSNTITNQVIIPCGTCIVMDHPGPQLTLLGGINVIGKIIFPNDGSYKITINTASIIVQGELDVQSTLVPITGTPMIRFVMIGLNDILSFQPVNENVNACPDSNCVVGFKSITVAGGSVNLNGIPPNTPTWVRLYDVAGGTTNNPTAIVVPSSVQGKWAVGADVLITSHTREWTDQQVRKITSITTSSQHDGYVQINLNSSIRRPTTLLESSDYAVEVALLSRNIVFEGGTDPSDGGHFWILSTPRVIQNIQGIEIVRFGQQGTLGRYPIHYHLSSNAAGSKIMKNSIRQSHQRCIVIHGTDNVMVQWNIAYDTKGHCFMLEDGIETGNTFSNNLGALTGSPDKIIPDNEETDDQPATFWITNPTNYFMNNVAAGSNSSGFWFELKKRGPRAVLYPSPVALPLGSFTGNVAHSNVANKGAFRMYPGGYRPLIENKATLSNLKGYRNFGRGMYIHICHNIDLIDSLFADNDISVDVDRAEAIGIYNLRIVGKSDSFGALIAREPKVRDICNRARGRTIGLDVHTWRGRQAPGGLIVKDVTFEDFDDVTCPGVAPVIVDSETQKQGLFEMFTTFENVIAPGGAKAVDFCEATSRSIDNIYLLDLDGSFRPNGINPSSPSSLVSPNPSMMTFVDSKKCTSVSDRCFNYCADTCFRSVRFDVAPKGTENYKLKVCERSNPSKCVLFGGGLYFDLNLVYNDIPRIFFAHLPGGSYDAVFLNGSGSEDWPSFVKMEIEPALCSATVSVSLREPPVAASRCQQLIFNGNADSSSSEPLFWLTALGGLELLRGLGVGGSNAVAGTRYGTTQLFQYVDNRCFTTGGKFIVSADMKLVDQNGTMTACNPNTEKCPTVGIYAESATYTDIAEVSSTVGTNGFQKASGVFEVDPFVATSPSIYFYVKSVKTMRLIIDNFSVTADLSSPVTSPVITTPTPVSVPLPIPAPYYSPFSVPVPGLLSPFLQQLIPLTQPAGTPVPVLANGPTMTTTKNPTKTPTTAPTKSPTSKPTRLPTKQPTKSPTKNPTIIPTQAPITSPINTSILPLLCNNLILNSNMERGYNGYWFGTMVNHTGGVNGSRLAVRHNGSVGSSGPTYNATLINKPCITAGSRWQVSVQVRLQLAITGQSISCNMNRNCPRLRILINDASGRSVVDVSARAYPNGAWNTNTYNNLTTSFQLPTAMGNLGTITIGIRGYSSSTRNLIFDDFYIRKQ